MTAREEKPGAGSCPGGVCVAVALLAATLALACDEKAADPKPPNLVLITIDTLRADHLEP